MPDFCSALYLGMRHPSCGLAPWAALTLGQPAALCEMAAAPLIAARLARLQGCQAACLLPSTLHLYWDLFGMFAGEPLVLLVDQASYPIARWGAERAQALGLPLRCFACGDMAALCALVRCWRKTGRRPLILADGYVPGKERAPPLAGYAALARQAGGYLLLDDTQALGILGQDGGGSARRHGLRGEHIVIGASLAKGFGVPLAVLAGSDGLIKRFMAHSQTRLGVEFDQVQAGAGGVVVADGLRQLAHRLVVQAGRLAHAAQGGGQHRRHFALRVAIPIAIISARTIILVIPGFGLRRRQRCRVQNRIGHRIVAPAPVARRHRAPRSPQRRTRAQAPAPAAPTAGAAPAFVLRFLFLLCFALPLPLLFPFILYGCAKRQHFK